MAPSNTSFGTSGKVLTHFGTSSSDMAEAIVVQGDGKFIVVGFTTNDGTNYDVAVARYNTDGSLDTTYGTGGKLTFASDGPPSLDSHYLGATLDGYGKLLISAESGGHFMLARVTTAGALDTTFNSTGTVITDVGGTQQYANGVAVQSNGKIIVEGNALISGAHKIVVVRYTDTGSVDTTFGTSGKFVGQFAGTSSFAEGVAIGPSDSILLGGEAYSTYGSIYTAAVMRLTSSGSLDTSFGCGAVLPPTMSAPAALPPTILLLTPTGISSWSGPSQTVCRSRAGTISLLCVSIQRASTIGHSTERASPLLTLGTMPLGLAPLNTTVNCGSSALWTPAPERTSHWCAISRKRTFENNARAKTNNAVGCRITTMK